MSKPLRLSRELEERAVMMIFEGEFTKDVIKAVGFKTNYEFTKYQREYPEFKQAIDQALIDSCPFLEDQLLTIPHRYREQPKVAEQLSKNIMKVLEYRNFRRYGNRQQHEISMNVSISEALDEAEKRSLRDVTNVLQLNPQKKED